MRTVLSSLGVLILMAILHQVAAEEIILRCIIHLPSSDKTFMSHLEITDQRVIGDGTNITKDVTITEADITFRVNNYFLDFLSDVKIDRASGAYTEIRTGRKSLAIINEWHGSCIKIEKLTR
jgi:hypothetical protein